MDQLEWPATEWWYWTLVLLAQCATMQWLVRADANRFPRFWKLALWTSAVVAVGACVGLFPTLLTQSEVAGGPQALNWEPFVWWFGGGLLLGLGIALLTRTLLGRRLARHPHCSRCRYDMSGARELRCPECGHAHQDASELLRIRRRRLPLAASCLAILVGLGLIAFPLVSMSVLIHRSPTLLLLALCDPLGYGGAWGELQERRADHPIPLTWAQREVFLWKTHRLLNSPGPMQDRDRARYFVETFPADPLLIPDIKRLATDSADPGRARWLSMLSKFPDKHTTVEQLLIDALYDPDDMVARTAEYALADLWSGSSSSHDTQQVPPVWLTSFALAGSELSRSTALRALGEYQPAITSASVAMLALAEPSPLLRSRAAALLAHADPHGPDARRHLVHLLQNDPDIRDELLGVVEGNQGLLFDPDVREAYANALLQTTPTEPRYALQQLATLDSLREWRVGVLVRALDAPPLRDAALWRLAENAPQAAAALPRLRALETELAPTDAPMSARVHTLIQMIEHD